jgi:hypothetical protein
MHANLGDERKDQAHTERRNNQSGGDASVMAAEVHHFSVVLLGRNGNGSTPAIKKPTDTTSTTAGPDQAHSSWICFVTCPPRCFADVFNQ